MELVHADQATAAATFTTRPAARQKPVGLHATLLANGDRMFDLRLAEDVRRRHRQTHTLLNELDSYLTRLRKAPDPSAMPDDPPKSPELMDWHMARAGNPRLPKPERDVHFQTWRAFLELEAGISTALATLFMNKPTTANKANK